MRLEGLSASFSPSCASNGSLLLRLLPRQRLCLSVATLALSTSRPVCVVLLANRLSLVLPYLLSYHTLLSSAVVSKSIATKWEGDKMRSKTEEKKRVAAAGIVADLINDLRKSIHQLCLDGYETSANG